jgi:LysM repeat protein
MTCEVKVNSIKYLEKEGATNDVRKIIDRNLFDKLNDQLTILAQTKYGLDTYGEKLFSINRSENIEPSKSTYRRDAKSTTYRAVPNKVLFDRLQEQFDERQTKGFNLDIDTDVEPTVDTNIDIALPIINFNSNAIENLNNQRSKQLAEALSQRLALGLNVNYQNVSKEEAADILKNRAVKYNGEAGFYYAGTVYLVGDNVSPRTVIHEFGHPLLQGLRMKNNILFQKLYKQAIGTEEGQGIKFYVESQYPELDQNTDFFKEEVINYALQLSAINKMNDQINTEGFDKFIQNVMAAIKKILRGIFGSKVKVSKINVDTSIEELADLLLEGQVEIDIPSKLKEEDIVMFGRDVLARAKELEKFSDKKSMQGIVDQIYDTNRKILTEAENFKGDAVSKKMLKETLFQKGTTRYLREVTNTLKDYLNTEVEGFDENEKIQNALDAAKESLDADLQRATALVNTLDTTNSMLKNMLSNISKINKANINNRSTVALLMLYKQNSQAWLKMVEEINELLDMDGKMMDTSNPFYLNLNEIVQNITRVNTNIANLLKTNNVQFYVEITGYMSEYVQDRLKTNLGTALKKAFGPEQLEKAVNDLYYKVTTQELKEEDINELVKKGVPKKILDGFLQEYKDLVIDKDKITEALTGGAKDVTWFNRWLESYSSSNDVVTGPLAMFIENEKSQVENIVWEKSMKFRKKLERLLPAVGFSKLNSAQLREKMGFLDTVFWVDKETGKPIEKKVWSYHGAFKDNRYHYDLLDYNLEEAKKTEDIDKIATAQLEFDTFKRDYMWQDFVPEFYEKDDIFKQSEVGKLAYYVRKQKLAAYNNLVNSMENELERFEEYSTIQAAYREYQQLFALTYEDGTPKVDDEANNVYDLSIAKILQEHREATRDFYEWRPVDASLQSAYNEIVDLLATKNIFSGDKEYEREMKKWERQNLRMDIDPEYWEQRNVLLTELREIQERIKEAGKEQFDIAGAYQTIGELVYTYKDQSGEPNSSDMGNDKLIKVKNLEQEISDFRSSTDARTGLSKDNADELYDLSQKASAGRLEQGSPESDRYFYLLDKVQESGISASDITRMEQIISELSSLTKKIPTIYYMETLNYNLSRLEVKQISEEDVEERVNADDFQELLEEDEKLAEWFNLNHYTIQKWNKETKAYETYYKRTAANNVSTPTDESYINFTEIIDKNTGEPILLKGAPGIRHSRREVKDEYRTIPFGAKKADYVGTYIDNKNQPLPRLYKPGEKYSAKDDRFINNRYFQMKASNNAEYKLLETIKEYHLQNQEGMSNYSKLYLDMPRYSTKRGDIWQAMQKGTYGSRFSELGKNTKEWVKQSFSRSANDAELDFNYDAKNNLVNTDLNGNQISYIPVSGIYNLDHEITDADIFRNLFKYALSVQTQSKLLESLPLVNSVLETLEDPANEPKELEKYDKNVWNLKGNLQKAKKKFSTNNRLGQVKSLIEREYYGRMVEGIEETHPVFGKWMQSLQGLSAMGSLALNIPSDLKNKYGAYVQVLLEGLGAEFITLKDFALARPWAERSMLEWSTKGIYQTGPGSKSTQLIQIFDPTFKSKDEFGREVERSLVKDLANFEWMYMHRKFGEMQVAVSLFGSFMFGQKVDQILTDGTKKTMRYEEAWQKDEEGIIRLKPGVHPGWNNLPVFHEYQRGETLEEIAKKYYLPVEELKAKNRIKTTVELEDGQEIIIAKSEKFLGLKNRIQGTSRKLFGTYDKMGQSEGNKLLIYRMFFFMRKWFTPMFMNRFGYDSKTLTWTRGGERYDWATGSYGKGFYLTAFQAMVKTIKSGTRDAAYLSTEEKVSLRKMAGEGLFVIGLSLLAMMIFGFDPEDDEKWNKIKKRSGSLSQDTFNTYGFISNHMLLLMLGVQAESSAFVPLPSVKGLNLGMDDYTKMITQTTSAWYNTIVLYADILGDVLDFITFSEMDRYKRDVGTMSFKEKGDLKIWAKIYKTFGRTGSTDDPEYTMQNMMKSQRVGR